MHHTLLPDNARKSLHREYRLRLIIVSCLMLSIAGIIGVVSLLPALIRIYYVQSTSSYTTVVLTNEDKEASRMKSEVAGDASELSIIRPYTQGSLPSDVIENILKLSQSIKITSITYSREAMATTTIILRGIAPTRASLLSFRTRLENASSSVDLPLSELTKSINIDFSMKIIKTTL